MNRWRRSHYKTEELEKLARRQTVPTLRRGQSQEGTTQVSQSKLPPAVLPILRQTEQKPLFCLKPGLLVSEGRWCQEDTKQENS